LSSIFVKTNYKYDNNAVKYSILLHIKVHQDRQKRKKVDVIFNCDLVGSIDFVFYD